MNAGFLARTVPGNVALLVTFEAASFLSVLFFVCFCDGFSSSCTSAHGVWIMWGELLYRRSSGVLGSLILLLLPSSVSPEEGVSGCISCCWWWPGGGGSIFRSFETLDQDVIPLLCLGHFCPLCHCRNFRLQDEVIIVPALKMSRDIWARSEVKREPALRWSRESCDSVHLKQLCGRQWRSVCLIGIYGC